MCDKLIHRDTNPSNIQRWTLKVENSIHRHTNHIQGNKNNGGELDYAVSVEIAVG